MASRKTTFQDVGAGNCETKEHQRSGTHRGVGRSYCYITCPFCSTTVRAYIWSLAGVGKRCPGCGALHAGLGRSYKLKEVTPDG